MLPRGLALVLAVGLTVAIGVAHAGAVVLYGSAYSGPTGPATLHSISPTTGAATAIGPIGFARVTIALCQTNPIAGTCISPPTSTVLVTINTNDTADLRNLRDRHHVGALGRYEQRVRALRPRAQSSVGAVQRRRGCDAGGNERGGSDAVTWLRRFSAASCA